MILLHKLNWVIAVTFTDFSNETVFVGLHHQIFIMNGFTEFVVQKEASML